MQAVEGLIAPTNLLTDEGEMMKNKLYRIFDRITTVFSPLVEYLFDHAEE